MQRELLDASVSPVVSPYPGYEPAYDWPPHLQPPVSSTAPIPGVLQHEQYMVTSNPTSARDTPEIVWHEPGDTIFGDSSDATSTTPATPNSFGDGEINRAQYGLVPTECHL